MKHMLRAMVAENILAIEPQTSSVNAPVQKDKGLTADFSAVYAQEGDVHDADKRMLSIKSIPGPVKYTVKVAGLADTAMMHLNTINATFLQPPTTFNKVVHGIVNVYPYTQIAFTTFTTASNDIEYGYDLAKHLRAFITEEQFLFWMEALGVSNSIGEAYRALISAEMWLEINSVKQNIKMLWCNQGWDQLKQEYYAVSTIVSGLGLAYSVEKGADIVTEVGQLVIDDLVETQPDISQFQSKGFRYLECMQQFVPPSKPPTSTSFNTSSSTQSILAFMQPFPAFTQPISAFTQPVLAFTQPVPAFVLPSMPPYMQYQLPSTHSCMPYQLPSQLTFVLYQPGSSNEVQIAQMAQKPWLAVNFQAVPASLPVPTSSPSSIPVSLPSSAMASVDSSIKPSSSLSSHGKKCKSNAVTAAELGMTSTAASSVQGTTPSQKQCSQLDTLKDVVQGIMSNLNDTNNAALATLEGDTASQKWKFNEVCKMMYTLEKNLLPKNLACLQMLFEEKPSITMGYKTAATHSDIQRMWWVKTRLESVGCDVPEYVNLEGS
ncbi:hypothetical protein J3A83DRAFT_4375256 [Scleroderma citrinum]